MIEISLEALQEALEKDPNTTHNKLGELFRCSDKTIAKWLKLHGLRTKRWSERIHSEITKQKISQTRISRGVAAGECNPNFGEKDRPWLEGEDHPFRKWHREHPEFGDEQRGKNNPIHKVHYLYEDPAYVENITRGIRAHVEAKRGSTYEETYGITKATKYREKIRAASPARMAKFNRKVTWPEKAIKQLLEELCIAFIPEAPIGYYTVDFLISEFQIVVQADGDFWHGNPSVYRDEDLSPTQRKQRRLDASCNAFLENRGYHVIRFWESDLKNKIQECRQRLIDEIRIRNE